MNIQDMDPQSMDASGDMGGAFSASDNIEGAFGSAGSMEGAFGAAGDMEDAFDAEADDSASDTLRRYVAFISDGLTYVISAAYVTEIITNHTTTHLPMVPSYISGIINLRGQIIPIIDVRRRMGKPPLEETEAAHNCIIVLNIRGTEIGITVDTITKALDIDEAGISPMPTSSKEILVNGIQTLPDGQTVLFFDCNMLIDNI